MSIHVVNSEEVFHMLIDVGTSEEDVTHDGGDDNVLKNYKIRIKVNFINILRAAFSLIFF